MKLFLFPQNVLWQKMAYVPTCVENQYAMGEHFLPVECNGITKKGLHVQISLQKEEKSCEFLQKTF